MEDTKPIEPSKSAPPAENPAAVADSEAFAAPAELQVISETVKTDNEIEAKADVRDTASVASPVPVAASSVVSPKTPRRRGPKTADLAVADVKPRPAKAVDRTKSVRDKNAKRSLKPSSNSVRRTPVEAVRSQTTPAPKKLKSARIKEKIMTTKTDNNVKAFVADIQEKASAVFGKGSALAGEIGNITKGNLAATAESGKIVGSGLQQLGTGYVAEGRAAFETLSAEVRELAAAKSPLDFFKLQGEFVRRNFEAAFAFGSKNSKDIVKLAQDASAPLVNQAKTVVETVRKVA